ncbi:MAG: hypothetical protein WCJ85_09680 [Chitinophagaceae bacterium]
MLKKFITLLLFIQLMAGILPAIQAQCSICAKTAAQMGEKPAKALNGAIVYLMATPFAIAGVVGFRWWKSRKD